jgi:phosphoribosylglycinamide formyltransferase-1
MNVKQSAARRLAPAATAKVRARVQSIVEALPDAAFRPVLTHASLEVRGKRFGWYMDDHHGDGRVVIECKGDVLTNAAQVATDPVHLHISKYAGHRGWIGYWLDEPRVGWKAVAELLGDAYEKTAPKRLTTTAADPRKKRKK